MLTEKDLANAIRITDIQSETRTRLERAIDDLNALKHQCYSEELRSDINTAMGLLEKHKDSFRFHGIKKTVFQEVYANK